MKKWIMIMVFCFAGRQANAQSQAVQQLLLNLEKLSQFKAILQSMYDGYKILHAGYTTIKDISEGSFMLHKTFLDALLQVSPAVRKYKRVAGIISYQMRIAKGYKEALATFRQSGSFTPEEIAYLGKVYGNLLKASGESLEELILVITSGSLRMSDEERLAVIDEIYKAVEDQSSFLSSFTNNTLLLSLQRKSEQVDVELSRKVFGF